MKITSENKEYEIDGDEFQGGKATIAEEDLAIAFSIVSEGFYSDIYGSIVRELSSNCVDAHVAIESTEPVKIKFSQKENVHFISFIDVGIGMNRKDFEGIFMSYFKSTKRESNAYIGAFGVGSKSPLGYVESFDIITRKDGIERHFILFKVPDEAPSYDMFYEKETSLPSGTEIRFAIPDELNVWDEIRKFKTGIKNQLAYFDNVVVEGISYNNHYNIYEGKYFKYRNGGEESDFDKVHIALEKVSYPLNFKKLGINEINCPIGVKFEIGELLVTKNRENLRYDNEEVNELIRQRIKLALEELGQIYNRQISESLDLNAYIENFKSPQKYIKFDEGVKLELPFETITDKNGVIRRKFLIKGLKDPYYVPLKGYELSIPSDPFFFIKVRRGFKNPRAKKEENITRSNLYNEIKSNRYYYQYFRIKGSENKEINNYLGWEFIDGNGNDSANAIVLLSCDGILEKGSKEYRRNEFANLSYKFDLTTHKEFHDYVYGTNNIFNRGKIKGVPYITESGINKSKSFIAYKKAMIKEIVNLVPKYEKVEPSEAYINYLKELKEKEKEEKAKNLQNIYDLGLSDNTSVFLDEFLNSQQLTIFGEKGMLKQLRIVESFISSLDSNSSLNRGYGFANRYKIIAVGKRLYKQLEKDKRAISMDKFMSESHPIFVRGVSALYIRRELDKISKLHYLVEHLKDFREDLYLKYASLISYTREYRNLTNHMLNSDIGVDLFNSIIDNAKANNWIDVKYSNILDELVSFFNGLEILKFVKKDDDFRIGEKEEKRELFFCAEKLIKSQNKKLDYIHYIELNPEELLFIEQFQQVG